MADGSWPMDSTNKTVTFSPEEAVGKALKVLAGHEGFGTAAEINVYEYVGSEPEEEFLLVDDRDPSLVYTGDWQNDSNAAFHGGTARYTNSADASVELVFAGTAIRWYGQRDTNFGTANVYIDGVLAEQVKANGSMAAGQLLFERIGLTPGEHTIRIVHLSNTIDLDYLAYAN